MFKGNSPGKLLAGYLVIIVLALFAEVAAASTGGGGVVPWDSWITKVLASFTGPVALIFSVLIFMGCGIAIASGQDFGTWSKAALTACFGASFIVGAQNIVVFFGGAVIPTGFVM